MKRKYTRVTFQQVAEFYNKGLNFSQIAIKLDCARNTVRKKIREYAIKTMCNVYVGHGRPKKTEDINASRRV